MNASTRVEHDLLGDRAIPASAYYGVHTLRALENFDITHTPISIYPDLIAALASIKIAAAKSNRELGLLDAKLADAIVADWYSGLYYTGHGTAVSDFNGALVWNALSFTKPFGSYGGEIGYWADPPEL
jgi:hypothetical protein